ncbi:MAG: hypothetical protein HY350_01720 [Candidatus Omnitrophica bacterium]|nr:hypothetical protein [Candidatus Omnitrophota bacterium]
MLNAWKRVLISLNFLLLAGCIVSGVLVGRQALQAKEAYKVSPVARTIIVEEPAAPLTRPPIDYYKIITDRQIFGVPSKEPEPDSGKTLTEKDIANLPKTPLQVSLKATIVFDNPALSFAIIEDLKTRKQDIYKIGEKVIDAEIISIYSDKVVLRRGGKDEILLLFDENVFSTSFTGKPKDPAITSVKPKPAGMVKPEKASENKWVIESSKIAEAVKASPDILSQANIAPYQPSGTVEGFKIDNIQPGSLYEEYGLKNNDVIKRVNGEVIDSMEKAIALGQKLISGGSTTVTVEIEREGSVVTLNYDIKR